MKRSLFLLGSALGVIASTGALAQTPAVEDKVVDNSMSTGGASSAMDIIVTANKREENLSKVGAAVSAISGESLATQRIVSGADLAKAIPALTYAATQNNTPVYTLRGVGFYEASLGASPDVSLYIDQAPLPYPIMASLALFDLERVEVLKGPQGTLFGNNATGGAINFIAAKPTREFSAGADLSYGRFNTAEVGGFVSGPVTDTLRVRLALKLENGDGWQRSLSRPTDRLGRQDNIAARFTALWEPTSRLRISVNVNGWRDQDDPQASQVSRLDIKNPVGSAGFYGTITADNPIFSIRPQPLGEMRTADWSDGIFRPYTNNKFWQSIARIDYDVTDDITVTSLTSFADLTFEGAYDNDGTVLAGFQLYNHFGKIKTFNQELRLANSGTSSFRWVVGGNYERTSISEVADQTSQQSSNAPINGFGVVRNDNFQKIRNYAAFANLEWDITPAITAKGGVRQSRSDRRSNAAGFSVPGFGKPENLPYTATEFFNLLYSVVYPGQVAPVTEGESFVIDTRVNADGTPVDPNTYMKTGRYFGKLKEDSTSWSAGVDFKPTDALLFYANVKKGYKSGSYPFLGAAIFTGLDPVVQESLLDYEVGLKWQLFDRKLSVGASAFYYDYRNKQLLTKFVDPVFDLIDKLQNVPKSTIKGVELELNARPIEGLAISLAGSYLDAKVKSYVGAIGSERGPTGLRQPIFGSYEGVQLPFVSKWQTTVRADYSAPISSKYRAFVGASARSQSKSYSTLALTAQNKIDYRIAGYTLVDGNIGIGSVDEGWRVSIWAKNIFNKFYVTNNYLAYDTINRMVGRPREIGVAASFKFN